MVCDAYRRSGGKNIWFMFIEADTYLSEYDLRLWSKQIDSRASIYAGAQVMIGEIEFAHGGSGFVLSGDAAKALANEYYGGPSPLGAQSR